MLHKDGTGCAGIAGQARSYKIYAWLEILSQTLHSTCRSGLAPR